MRFYKIKVILDGTGLDEVFLATLVIIPTSKAITHIGLSHKGASGPTDKRGIKPKAISANLLKSYSSLTNKSLHTSRCKNKIPRYLALLI